MLVIKQLLSYIPTKLPVGKTEFDQWSESIIELAGPYADKDSMKYAIASNLIHLPHTRARMPKAYFVNTLRKAAANQVASAVFQEIKQRQEEKIKQLQAEATAKQEAANDSSTVQQTQG